MDLSNLRSKKAENASSHKQESKTWYEDRYETIRVQRNFLAVVTLASLITTLLAAWSVSLLTPQKTVKPFVIQFDEKTGYAVAVQSEDKQSLTADDAIKRYFVVKYINAREGYDAASFEQKYRIVQLMTEQGLFRDYKRKFNPDNPDDPIQKYARHTALNVQFKSITFITENTAQARIKLYTTGAKHKDATAGGIPDRHMIVYMSFEFANIELDREELYINPLGFFVTSYAIEEEVVSS